MKTLRHLCLVFALLTGCAANLAPKPAINPSVIALHDESGEIFCSGFVIDRVRRHVMTAEHCIDTLEQPIMNQKRGWEIYHVPPLDVAILKADAVWNVKALKPRMTVPGPEEKISAYGYAGGRDTVRRIDGKILFPVFLLPPSNIPMTLFAPSLIKGMSGGPIVDKDGLVVGVNQLTRTKPDVSIAYPMVLIYELTKDYWEAPESAPAKIE